MNQFLYNFLAWINSWVGSWGIAMIVFTVLVRLVLSPLDFKSRVSMRKTTKLQPQLQALQKKYANDKDKLNAKTAELYKKEHINPLSSCLPLLLTWPILIAVFGAMRMAANEQLLIQLGQILQGKEPALEPFLWIRNLWMPDNIFNTAYPDVNTLRIIPTDQWLPWFQRLSESGLPAMLQDLNLTEASFEGNTLAATVQSGYLPTPDETMQTGKGICFDYAALAASMLRSQGIPTRMVFGYVAPDQLYHAWNMFYTEETGWVTVKFEVSANSWVRLDLTFAANGADNKFIGDGSNYADVYYY